MQLAGEQKMMFFYFFPGLTFFLNVFYFLKKYWKYWFIGNQLPLGGMGGSKRRCQRCQKGESQYHCNKVRCAIGRAEQLEKNIYFFINVINLFFVD